MSSRILMHVHHMMGIGHLRRSLAIARVLARRGAEVRCLTGGLPVPGVAAPGVELVQLAPARARDFTYKVLVDGSGEPVTQAWYTARRQAVVAALQEFAPRVVVTETFPFGRRRLRGELLALLETAARMRPRPRVVASIRDLLEGFPGPDGRSEDVLALVAAHYDHVLVHGDPSLAVLAETFPAAPRLAAEVTYTGYVTEGSESAVGLVEHSAPDAADGEVLVSTGGGVVGEELVRVASAARAHSGPLAERPWRILAGPNMERAVFEALRGAAPRGVTIERNRVDFPALLAAACVSVSQAGYNTVCDVLRARARAVLVPFHAPGQHEQARRAALLADRGLAVALPAQALNPLALGRAVQHAAACRRPDPGTVRLDGAERSARALLGWA